MTKSALLLLSLLLTGTAVHAANTVRLTNGEWPPYMSEKLPEFGKITQITTEAFKHSNIDAEYTFFSSWARAIEEAKKGESWAGSIAWTRNEEREADFLYSDAIMILEDTFFYLKNKNFDWQTAKDLSSQRIGLTRGYYYGKLIEKAEANNSIYIERTNKELLNFLKLLRERIDLVAATKDVGYTLIRQNLTPEEAKLITHHPKPLRSIGYHLIISKKVNNANKIIAEFNKGLQELISTGRYEQIYNQL